jgi:hypothetical protein
MRERRVLCLGDSLVYGQGVAEEATLPAHLEVSLQELAQGAGSWRAINGGLRAYSTNQEVGLLEELGARLQPDVVVMFWFWNDFRERPVQATHDRLRAWGPVAFDTSAKMEGKALWRWRLVQVARRSALVMYAWDQWRAGQGTFPDAVTLDTAIAKLGEHLGRYRELCTELGARPIFALVPDSASICGDHPSRAFALRAGSVAKGLGIEVIDLLPSLQELYGRTRRLPILPFDGHYTDEANRVMARQVAERLVP